MDPLTLTPAELRDWRERHGLTLEQAAEILEVAKNTVWRWEQEPGTPHHEPIGRPRSVRAVMRERDNAATQ